MLNKILYTINILILFIILNFVYIILYCYKPIILKKKTKILIILVHLFIFGILPFMYWKELNWIRLKIKIFTLINFLITNSLMCSMIKNIYLNSIFNKKHFIELLSINKLNISKIINLIHYFINLIFFFIIFNIWISQPSTTVEIITWKYIIFTIFSFILLITFILYLFFKVYNNFEIKKIKIWNLFLNKNHFYSIWILSVLSLNMLSVLHILLTLNLVFL